MTQYTLTEDAKLNIIGTYYLNGNFRILRRKDHIVEAQDQYKSYCFYDRVSHTKVSEWTEGTYVMPVTMPAGTVVEVVREVPVADCNTDCFKIEVISTPDKDFEDLRGLLITTDDMNTIIGASNG